MIEFYQRHISGGRRNVCPGANSFGPFLIDSDVRGDRAGRAIG